MRDLWAASKELWSDCSAGLRLDARKNRGTIQQPFPGVPPQLPQHKMASPHAQLGSLGEVDQEPPACTSPAAKAEGKRPKLSFPTSRGKVQKG